MKTRTKTRLRFACDVVIVVFGIYFLVGSIFGMVPLFWFGVGVAFLWWARARASNA